MPQTAKPAAKGGTSFKRARVLVVDDEPGMIELVADVVGRATNCKLLTARDLREARNIIQSEDIDLLLADVHLPDGDGMSLLPQLHLAQPGAAAVVITGKPSVSGAVEAIRAGIVDFLPKPFSADHLLERVNKALAQQALGARKEKRLGRLRIAVRRLNTIRRTISKKVDLLCNDLIGAYGALSKQMDVVRIEEGFRKLLAQSQDLEQLLCHTMDSILRHAGYTNVAVWLASEEQEFELGAYMKYTIPGEKELIDAIKDGMVRTITRDNFVHLEGEALNDKLTPAERPFLTHQTVMGVNCTYLGESLATVVMFRDNRCPFTDADEAMIQAISPIFAVALANIVRHSSDDDAGNGGEWGDDNNDRDNGGGGGGGAGGRTSGIDSPFYDGNRDIPRNQPKKPRREKGSEADWWKRGEAPPF
jgi:FixJ family two-component response regulator